MFGAKKEKEPKKTLTPMEDALSKIRNAWIASLISMSITLLFVLLAIAGTSIAGVDAWAFADVALIAGLGYGVLRKSRVCAVLLFVYFVASKLLMWIDAGKAAGAPMAIVFMYFYAQGIVGTFKYHKLAGAHGTAPPEVEVKSA